MDQKTAFEAMKLGFNIYLTGPAGSGKSYLLNQYINWCQDHKIKVAVTASTGIAATHINGITIHSWSGLGVKDRLTEKDIVNLKKKPYIKKRIRETQVLIIDEISMLHDFQLDLLDQICKLFKDPFLPFGGLQVILSGDFFQLPPVSQQEKKAQFVPASKAWQTMDVKICYLEKVYRQKEGQLSAILQAIRSGSITEKAMKSLMTRHQKEIQGWDRPTRLFTHNANVNVINSIELNKISAPSFLYRMHSRGNDYLIDTLKKSCLAPEELILKKDAVVMFVKNNFDRGYINGTLGQVIDFDDRKLPIVRTLDGKDICVTPESWVIEEEEEIVAMIGQLPLRLAWAITVHKSQGMSLDAVEMDLNRSFEYGMGYVALSRARSLSGIKLLGINDLAYQVNPMVLEMDKLLQQLAGIFANDLKQMDRAVKSKMQKNRIKSEEIKEQKKHK